MPDRDRTDLAAHLLRWYDDYGRRLPWRARPGEPRDPYRVWLAEIMLQQTRVQAATPYIRAFLRRWPTVRDLAAAPDNEVLAMWAGLGYYARARNLHRCAREIVGAHGGSFPDTEAELRRLPGFGPYTAAAVAAIAFGRRTAAVDGNVERVLSRLDGVEEPLPGSRPRLRAVAAALVPEQRPGDYAQALMDLGATVCTPRAPRCDVCPWAGSCVARARGTAVTLPRRHRAPPRPLRHGAVFRLARPDGAVLLRRRPPEGLLGGMLEFPGTPWGSDLWTASQASAFAPDRVRWRELSERVRHTFTHFHLELVVFAGATCRVDAISGRWVLPEDLDRAGLPTVMRKVARLAAEKTARPA